MRLFVPTIGTRIQLIADWTFDVYDEYRNKTLSQYQKAPTVSDCWSRGNGNLGPFTLPADTVLVLKRIFIRQNMDEFDSLTFIVESTTAPIMTSIVKPKRVRFWAKLDDCNRIEFDFPPNFGE